MEFEEFCKQFRRMVSNVSLEENALAEAADSDYEEDWLVWATHNPKEAEEMVEDWATQNPEPIYPTFGEYLRDMANHDNALSKLPLNELLDTPMPEKVAEQYKVVPLNLHGMKKYVSDWL